MFRLYCASAVLVGVIFASGLASAQTAFLEGHIFNKLTGVPLSGAAVRIFENVTVGPLPVELAAGTTDANGFYQFEVDEFLGFPAVIEVVCGTARGEIRGGSFTVLREGLIRRDVYLEASRRLTRCHPIEPHACSAIEPGEFGLCRAIIGWGIDPVNGQCAAISGCGCDERCEGRIFPDELTCQRECGGR